MNVIGIDASNIAAGGGLTHLRELIDNYHEIKDQHLVIFANKNVLNLLPDKTYITKIGHSWLNKGTLFNMLWRLLLLRSSAKKHGVEIFFTPGGNFLPFRPYISMSQNMLVFESKERNRFPSILDRLRYVILEFKQILSFYFSSGIIYISEYARSFIQKKYPFLRHKKSGIIYHGVAERFNSSAQDNLKIEENFTKEKPFRLLYISIINYYKHQDKLIEATKRLNNLGVPIELHLIGPLNPKMKSEFEALLESANGSVIHHGKIPYENIHEFYGKCDLFVFASTCENMPNILIEAMRSNVPILCSNYGPMPEFFKDAGLYFDPINIDDICSKILEYKNSLSLRKSSSIRGLKLASAYSWSDCSKKTFDFIID